MIQLTGEKSSSGYSAAKAWVIAVVFAFIFPLLIWYLSPGLARFTSILLPDQGADWYYWKLPARDTFTMAVVWGFYLAHQVSVWGLIWWAQRNLLEKNQLSKNLSKFNFAMLAVNILFVASHLVESQYLFDGLAQDVPIMTSQGSVIVMLAIVLILENPRRGLLLGRKAGKPFTASVVAWFRKSHQYLFAWALVYTFWFHPMAGDPQLLTGFLYMMLLFTQVSLAYTWIHLDKRWVVFLEGFVGLHALFVAVYNTLQHGSLDMWPMFFAGFAAMFVFTGLYAFKAEKRVYGVVTGAWLLLLTWIYAPAPYGYARQLSGLIRFEPFWIPIILYLLAIVFAGAAYLKIRK